MSSAASPLAIHVADGEVFYDPHPGRQAEVVSWIVRRVGGKQPQAGNLWLWGNRGGGKSRLVRAVFHSLALAYPGLRYVIARRNYPDLTKNHLIYVGAEMRKFGGQYLRSEHTALYDNGSIGFFQHCETEADVEKIVGAEAALLFVDEAPQIAWDFLMMMRPSLRVPRGAPFRTLAIYGGNPTGDSIDEIWRYFVEKDVERESDQDYNPLDFHSIELRLEDNPSLDPQEYRKQFVGLPEHIRKAWQDGVRMESRTLFTIHKQKDGQPYHYIQELPHVDGTPLLRVPWIQLYRGFDMGFFPDPACCLWIVILGKQFLVVHERTWFQTIAKDLAADILSETKELFGRDVQAVTYVDPKIAIKTGSDTVTVQDILELNGVACEPSINDRILYADAIHGLLGEEVAPGVPRLQIYEPGCPNLAKFLPRMRWDDTNPRKMANHAHDHWPIALAYVAISSGVLTFTDEQKAQQEPIWKEWLREVESTRRRRRR